MKHLAELKSIVDAYSRIRKELDYLEEQVTSLNLKKLKIEMELSQIREAETSLIDRIKQETGQEVDYYELLKQLN